MPPPRSPSCLVSDLGMSSATWSGVTVFCSTNSLLKRLAGKVLRMCSMTSAPPRGNRVSGGDLVAAMASSAAPGPSDGHDPSVLLGVRPPSWPSSAPAPWRRWA